MDLTTMPIQNMELFYPGYDPQWILGRDKLIPLDIKPILQAAGSLGKAEHGPIEMKVPFCCEGCKKKVEKHLLEVEGVDSVKVDAKEFKVTVTGKVKPEECLKVVNGVRPRSDFWQKKKSDGKKHEDAQKNDGKKANH